MGDAPNILDGIARQMKALAERQRVVAQNIANSETPGYKAQDTEPADFGDLLANGRIHIGRPSVRITSGMARLGATAPRNVHVVQDRQVSEIKPDGNTVTLEDQLLKMGQLQADFTAMTNLYRKQQGLLKTALGKSPN